jgi:predicted aminopeptidase
MPRSLVCLFVVTFWVDFEVGYLWQLAKGQVGLLFKAKAIEKVLKENDLSKEERAKLELINEIREFARREIGLETSDNYTTYVDIGSGPVSWNLVVCPKDDLEPLRWSYPVVGTVPYRGYFDRHKAEEARDRYSEEGYDTYLRPVGAYSTLGWFSDPILSTMLRYLEPTLADLVIHELTHATVWIEGDVTFNESLASFVGETGALMWLREKYGEDTEAVGRVLMERDDGVVFRKFMHQIASRLDSLYQSDLPRVQKLSGREVIFDAAKHAFENLPLKTNLYASFPTWTLNNARLALYRVYRERTDIFARIYAACRDDLRRTVEVLAESERDSKPSEWLERWLEKP